MVEGQRDDLDSLNAPDLARVLFNRAGEALLIVEPLSERVRDANPTAQRLTGLRTNRPDVRLPVGLTVSPRFPQVMK